MLTLEEIERAVEKLPAEDFVKLTAWMDDYMAEAARHSLDNGAASGAGWFDIYMQCPSSFEIPPRQKQFYMLNE